MIALIDLTGNNLSSLTNAIKSLGYDCRLTHDPKELEKASHIILPGVGSAQTVMPLLNQSELPAALSQLTKPVLGICLGMQLLFEYSEEGEVNCLNLIPGRITKLPQKMNQPIPHMGWSKLQWLKASPLSQGLSAEDYVYFVHSFALTDSDYALARCQYSANFAAIIQYKNFYGMQFHPEKSSTPGLQFLKNFLNLEEAC